MDILAWVIVGCVANYVFSLGILYLLTKRVSRMSDHIADCFQHIRLVLERHDMDMEEVRAEIASINEFLSEKQQG